jgi:hypothetical protein
MDHHCPWVDNCIGFYNKKFFIQLLCYFFLTSFGLLITYTPYSIEIIKTMINTNQKENSDINYKNIFILLNNIILLGFTIVDFNFTKFHFKLISSNLTTIETLDNDLMKNQKYDIGFNRNFRQVFGDNILLWFLPINLPAGYPNGDGLSWPMKEEIMPMENMNENNNEEATMDNNNNTDKNITKNNSFTGNKCQTRSSSMADYPVNTNAFNGKYSKYNSVKRNPGNFNSNSTRYDSNSNSTKANSLKK